MTNLAQQQKVVDYADARKINNRADPGSTRPTPERPVAPKRFTLTGAGFGIGLAIGLLLALAFESRRLFTIQTTEDAKHYTGLPVLASIPELLTAAEARAIPRRRAFAMAAGIAFAIVSVPTLAFGLQLTHVFEKFLLL
jgi:hypothetical protein